MTSTRNVAPKSDLEQVVKRLDYLADRISLLNKSVNKILAKLDAESDKELW